MNFYSACSNTKPSFSFFVTVALLFIHHCVCWPQKNMPDHLLPKGQACVQPVVTKSKRAFSPLIALCSHAILLFPHTSLTSLHTLDQLPCVCVFVSWSVAITKWWPFLTRRPLSSCRADLLLNSLVIHTHTRTHTHAFYYTFHSCTNATGH